MIWAWKQAMKAIPAVTPSSRISNPWPPSSKWPSKLSPCDVLGPEEQKISDKLKSIAYGWKLDVRRRRRAGKSEPA
jgi:hypothetical protein